MNEFRTQLVNRIADLYGEDSKEAKGFATVCGSLAQDNKNFDSNLKVIFDFLEKKITEKG